MNISMNEAKRLRVSVKLSAGSVAGAHLVLAKQFYEIRNGVIEVKGETIPLWQYWGYDNWENYVEHDTHFHYGWANAHIRMYEKVVIQCKDFFKATMIHDVGITNLIEVSKVITKSTAQTWLRKATEMSCCELKHEVMKYNFAAKGVAMPDARIFTRVMPGRVHKKMKKALKIGEEVFGYAAPYKTLEAMADEFIRRNESKKPVAKAA